LSNYYNRLNYPLMNKKDNRLLQIPVAAQFEAYLCSRSIAGIAGSNPPEGMAVCLLCLLCVVQVAASARGSSLVQRSPTGYVCVCV
jgi:hypothetical protein